ncbi:hypothetical protein B0H15DRAFT_766310 [Mycena belliarum]|uniref:Uncharacterized protein n=1 Tax=Mycena belliarum TaxID=1033014 RepID=A0AAD6UQS1_9AGAR|nr:hypothetical protein B0H15DRAFT_766310 [Mycena belliae]
MSFLAQSFTPVYASERAPELGHHSMVIGGSVMYLNPDEAWPTCPTCTHPLVPLVQLNVSSENTPDSFRAHIPGVVASGQSLATMIQLFVCPAYDCYDTSITYSTDTRSWILRIATVPASPPAFSESHLEEARAKIEQGYGFMPVRMVETWVAGKEETLHQELMWDQDDSEEFYAAHEPEHGLKLLGHTVRGKYYCSNDECPRAGTHAHPSRRELIQLGDRFSFGEEDEEALALMAMLGNTWIEQCIEHPEVLTLTMSGDW